MQVIAGKYRGRKLVSLDSDSTRPTLQRVKESLFSMIDSKILGSNVLDLFAGSGALGIEALSRGACSATFVDSNPAVKKVLETNLARIGEPHEIRIGEFSGVLNEFKTEARKFDLVFLDPPYKSNFGAEAMRLLAENNLLNQNAMIVFEQEGKKVLQNVVKGYIIQKVRDYNSASLTILSYIGD